MKSTHKEEKRKKDKSQRATCDGVLDDKTRDILYKLVKRDALSELAGCISTGKEANVYTGSLLLVNLTCKLINNYKNIPKTNDNEPNNISKEENDIKPIMEEIKSQNYLHYNSLYSDKNIFETITNIPCAIKIYQTSIMQFKDRLKYIKSEKRFETFCNKNPRKLVKIWAEKEVRNLKRLNKHNIPSPVPLYLKKNILIMSLIMKEDGEAAPRLKDAQVSDYQVLYSQAITLIWEMYNKCGLIHSDFSEYNILCVKDILYVIDMGQAVEKSHDNADEFLIKDILNVNNYFERMGSIVSSINDVFVNVTGKTIPVCLRGIDILPGISIPVCIGEVNNAEDLSTFLKSHKVSTYERQDKAFIPVKTSSERKSDKIKVKTEQREKRMNKTPKKEKNKLKKLKASRR